VACRPHRKGFSTADVSRLREEVGFANAVSLADGLAASLAYWQQVRPKPPLADLHPGQHAGALRRDEARAVGARMFQQ